MRPETELMRIARGGCEIPRTACMMPPDRRLPVHSWHRPFLTKTSYFHMLKTSYCQQAPIGDAILRSFSAMSLDEQIEIEEIMQRWRDLGIENGHIYEWIGSRFEVLVRRVPFSRRRLVAVHDKNRGHVVAVNLETGALRDVVAPAYLLIGWDREAGSRKRRNTGWTG